MIVSVRTGITFARLVYESRECPGDRSYSAWTSSRHMLDSWRGDNFDWNSRRLIYIERCRLKPGPPMTEIPPGIRCEGL